MGPGSVFRSERFQEQGRCDGAGIAALASQGAAEVMALVDTLSPAARAKDKKARRKKDDKAAGKRRNKSKGKSASKKR